MTIGHVRAIRWCRCSVHVVVVVVVVGDGRVTKLRNAVALVQRPNDEWIGQHWMLSVKYTILSRERGVQLNNLCV